VEDDGIRRLDEAVAQVAEGLERNSLLTKDLRVYENTEGQTRLGTDRAKGLVCSDHPAVNLVLQLVQLDVAPERLDDPSPSFVVRSQHASYRLIW
jgi:hypothetical protein